MKGPTFSVIIAVYNGADTIGRAIESVLAQSYPPLELVIVDDGSTDGTADAIARFGADARYYYQANAGVSAARNTGATMARGEWLAFLDADDWHYPGRIRWHAEWIEEDPSLDFLIGDFDHRDSGGTLLRRCMGGTEAGCRMLQKSDSSHRVLIVGDELGHSVLQHFDNPHTLSVPCHTFLELGGYPVGVRVAEDLHFLIRLCAHSHRVGVVCRPMGVYVIHSHSAIRSNSLDAQRETVRALKPLSHMLKDASPAIRQGLKERMRRARLDLAVVLLRNGKRLDALLAVLPSFWSSPGWKSFRDILSILRNGGLSKSETGITKASKDS